MKVMLKRLTISGSTLRIRDNAFKNKILKELIKFVFPYFKTGQVKCYIDSVFLYLKQVKLIKDLMKAYILVKVILKYKEKMRKPLMPKATASWLIEKQHFLLDRSQSLWNFTFRNTSYS